MFEVKPEDVDYLKGDKFSNLVTFKEKAGLTSLYLKKEDGDMWRLRAIGTDEGIDNLKFIMETHMSLHKLH